MSRSRLGLLGCLVSSLILSGCVVGSTAKQETKVEKVERIESVVTSSPSSSTDLDTEIDGVDKEIGKLDSSDFDENGLDDTKIIDAK